MKNDLAAKGASFAFERARLKELELKVEQQNEMNVALQQKIDSIFSQFPAPSSVDNKDKTAVAAAAIPKSCADLRYLGHTINGLYLIMGTDKVETVFCDFTVPLPSDPSKITFQVFTSNLQLYKIINHKINKINDDAVFSQISRRGLDKLTSNRRPFISTFREIVRFSTQQIRRFLLMLKD